MYGEKPGKREVRSGRRAAALLCSSNKSVLKSSHVGLLVTNYFATFVLMDITVALTLLPCTIGNLAKEAGIPYTTLQKKLSGKDARYKLTYANKVDLLTALQKMTESIAEVRVLLKKSVLEDLKQEYGQQLENAESNVV